jgi:O-antigen/teichoic acid export membrane protein
VSNDLGKRSLELVAGAGVAALLTLAALVYVGRAVGPNEYAEFSAALAVIYIVTLAMSPLIPALSRVAAAHTANGRADRAIALRRSVLAVAWKAVILSALLGAIIVAPLARWLRFRSPTPLAIAIVTSLVFVLLAIDRGFLQGLFRFRPYNLNVVAESAIRAAAVVLLLQTTRAAGPAMLAWASGTIAAYAMIVFAFRGDAATSEATSWSEVIALLRPMLLLMVALAAFQNTDVLAVKRWLPAEVAGAYGAAGVVARGFGALFVPLYALAGPLLTEAREKGRSVFAETLRLTAIYVGLAIVPLAIVALWPDLILSRLYGPQYAVVAPIFAPLCGVTVASYIGVMLSQGLLTIGRYRFVLIYAVCAAAQLAGLGLYHATVTDVLRVLWVCQGAAFVLVTIVFLNSQKTSRDGSNSSSA